MPTGQTKFAKTKKKECQEEERQQKADQVGKSGSVLLVNNRTKNNAYTKQQKQKTAHATGPLPPPEEEQSGTAKKSYNPIDINDHGTISFVFLRLAEEKYLCLHTASHLSVARIQRRKEGHHEDNLLQFRLDLTSATNPLLKRYRRIIEQVTKEQQK